MSAVKVYSTFKTLLDVVWSGIADGEVLLRSGTTVDGIATSTGGNDTADSGKLVKYSSTGGISATRQFVVKSNGVAAPQVVIYAADNSSSAALKTTNITTGRVLELPDIDGTLSTAALSESLTNKKLGSLTTNGLVTTSAGDGTLGVTLTSTGGNGSGDSGKVATFTSTGTLGASNLYASTNVYADGAIGCLNVGLGVYSLIKTQGATVTDRTVTFTLPDAAGVTITFPTTSSTLATLGANTFTGTQTYPGGGTIIGLSGAITIAASGTNQAITLTPSGTGVVNLGSAQINSNGDVILSGARRLYATSSTYLGNGGTIFIDGTASTNGYPFSFNAASGAATGSTVRVKAVASIADNTATNVLTVTIPNSAQSATLRVTLTGSLGAGGAIGANEATGSVSYDFAICRTAGVNAVVVASSSFGSASANVSGASTVTVTAAASAISGAVGASNTFTVQVTIARGSGSSTNHTCLVRSEIINANASGITVA